MDIRMDLDQIKDDKEKIQNYGIKTAKKMCQTLYNEGVRHFHLYTLNQEPMTIPVLDFLKSL